jgi:IS5 family transposase
MLGKSPSQNQKNLFQPLLKEFINMNHELVLLSNQIDWESLEQEFSVLYSSTGTPAMPIRMMSGLLILKQLYDLGDETVIPAWIRDPYMQYFCGEAHFQWKQPCDPSDLVHFRKRIGEKGVEKIFQQSVRIHGKQAMSKELNIDTTAQEKNITFPTDTKLRKKIIDRCVAIAKKEKIELRQSYKRTVKSCLLKSRFSHHPKRKKQARAAQRKIKTIAGRLVRELYRKLPDKKLARYQNDLELFTRVLNQELYDKDKVYSLHEPQVSCIAKGKSHKPYEFGNKASIATTKYHNVIVAAASFQGNPHDSKTLDKTLAQHQRITGIEAQSANVDRGYRGIDQIRGTQIIRPSNNPNASPQEKQNMRKRFRRRASIEPVISHLKHQYRMLINYLKGTAGDAINILMSAAAFNFKSWMNKIKRKLFFAFPDFVPQLNLLMLILFFI